MKMVQPYKSSLSDTSGNSYEYLNNIISTNATDETYAEYDPAVAYTIGATVKLGALKRWYQAIADSTGVYPYGNVTSWVDMGALNSYACFDKKLNTKTTFSTDLIIELDVSRATTVSLLNMENIQSVTIDIQDTNTLITTTQTVSLRDYGVNNLYDYAYKPFSERASYTFDIEWYPASKVTLTFPTTTECTIGAIVSGVKEDTGVTLYGTSVGLKDYSVINEDAWGNIDFVPRGVATVIDAKLVIDTVATDTVLDTFKKMRASLNLIITDERDDGISSLTTLGFVKDVKIPLTPQKSEYSISIIGVI